MTPRQTDTQRYTTEKVAVNEKEDRGVTSERMRKRGSGERERCEGRECSQRNILGKVRTQSMRCRLNISERAS